MVSRQISDLDPRLQPTAQQFLDECARRGVKALIDCTWRSDDEQDADFAKGRDQNGNIIDPHLVITHARAGQSAHNCVAADGTPAARAFDIAIYGPDGKTLDWDGGDDAWKVAHAVGRMLGLALGADWPKPKTDGPHMEMQNWQNVNANVDNSQA